MTENQSKLIDLKSRYDEFQSEAVRSIVSDYAEKINGRYLLVIPTGGGKTFTAVKAISALFDDGFLDTESQKVLWVAHRQELVEQAIATLNKYESEQPERSHKDNVIVMMVAGAAKYIANNSDIKLLVIDEAHHAAVTNVMYGPLFDYPNLGILGLTATPSRHDGKPLEFDRESYSIGFPDLIEKQIIISPEVRQLVGGRFEGITAFGTRFDGLDALSTDERNQKIIQHISSHTDEYTKVIIYAGSVRHTLDLCNAIRQSALAKNYESVDYIVGEGWSGGEDKRDKFIKRIKSYRRSIVVNFDVLSEGYDDPRVNTIVMARPSRSKLVYMQAVGRGVRIDPDNPSKRSFIVEVVDDLPNIRYRIDNRWLFSEISDFLEPRVTDIIVATSTQFERALAQLYKRYDVDSRYRSIPKWSSTNRYSMLLFRYYASKDKDKHIAIVIDNSNRRAVSNWFNFLSRNMEKFVKIGVHPEQAMKMARHYDVGGLEDPETQQLIMDAMEESEKQRNHRVTDSEEIKYWISFVAFRYRQEQLSDDLLNFMSEMVNIEQMTDQILQRNFQPGAHLVRFPLPLKGYVGEIITAAEFRQLAKIIYTLDEIKKTVGHKDHRRAVRESLDSSVLPVDLIHRDALVQIVREDKIYHMELE